MKIALVNPLHSSRYPQPPIGLALIAAILERNGYPVTVLDANALGIAHADIPSHISTADIIGLTAMTPTIKEVAHASREIKTRLPDVKIILGGTHGTLVPEETLNSISELDIIVRGEGETTIIELLEALENKSSLDNVQGISYRINGEIKHNPERGLLKNLDPLPFLAYHQLPLCRYKPHPPHGIAFPFASIITSRGCPYRCSYCSKPIFGSIFRAQSPQRVVDEIEYYTDKFKIREIAFYDDVFTLDKKRTHDIADLLIRTGKKLYWTCESRVNLVDKDLLRHMKAAGCYAIAYGIEAASPQILKIIQKGISPAQVSDAVKATREAGIQTIGYFMIGSPGETRETINATINFARDLRLDYAQFSITTPLPGSKLYKLYLEAGGVPVPWESFVYEGIKAGEAPVFESSSLKRKDLIYFRSLAYKRFYFRIAYICQRISQVRSWGDLMLNLKGLLMLVKDLLPVKR